MSNQPKKIRLLLVDDHELVRLGLRAAFEEHSDIEVVGEAATTDSAVSEALRLEPDVVLMDLRLPGGGGVQACREILADRPAVHILFLTSYSDQDSILAAAFAGARGYLLKEIGSDALVQAVRSSAAGQMITDPAINQQMLAWIKASATAGLTVSPIDTLSPQEKRVVSLVADGKSNKEIAAVLELSPKTVRNYLANAFDKLQISRRAELVKRFGNHDPIDIP
jgi:two-component system, NarL family, response regulator DevR